MLSVIVADDEETIRNGLIRLIRSYDMGLEVVASAADGREALELVARYRPEILLIDINMPHMNGLDAIEEIRRVDQRTKIVIISGYGQFEYAQRALALGVFNYLLKPVDYKDFKGILQKAAESFQTPGAQPLPDLGTQIADYIRSNHSQDLTAQALAERFHISQPSLTRIVKQKTGRSFTDFLNETRIGAAKELLLTRDCTVGEVAEQVGYSSQHYFSRVFKNYTGLTPQRFRAGEDGGR